MYWEAARAALKFPLSWLPIVQLRSLLWKSSLNALTDGVELVVEGNKPALATINPARSSKTSATPVYLTQGMPVERCKGGVTRFPPRESGCATWAEPCNDGGIP